MGITFLVGGGCDAYTEYVELLIDGLSVARATGSSCSEKMERFEFPIAHFVGRAAQIRVVDASSYGHINVDDFTFDWDMNGGLVNPEASTSTRPTYGGPV